MAVTRAPSSFCLRPPEKDEMKFKGPYWPDFELVTTTLTSSQFSPQDLKHFRLKPGREVLQTCVPYLPTRFVSILQMRKEIP